MSLKSWLFEKLRKIPHPHYGKCGGANRDCSSRKPMDFIDEASAYHDEDLYQSTFIDNLIERQKARDKADIDFVIRIRNGNIKELGIYGRFYRWLILLGFSHRANPKKADFKKSYVVLDST